MGVTSPFWLGGCLLELPYETDDALQQKFFFVNIFRKSKKIFPDIQKRGQKNFPNKNQLNSR
jgi:hypothetical protein